MTDGPQHELVVQGAGAFEYEWTLDAAIGVDDKADADIQIIELDERVGGDERLGEPIIGAGWPRQGRG